VSSLSLKAVKSTTSSEQDGHIVVAIGDDARDAAQSVGDRCGEHVQEQELGTGQGPIAGANRVLEEQIGSKRHARHVQYEERGHDRCRDLRRVAREPLIDQPGDCREHDEAQKPRNRALRTDDEQRTEWRDQRPQAHRARREVPAKAPLQQKWQRQHEEQLAVAEERDALCPREDHERDHGDHLVEERDRRRPRQPERQIGRHPDHGEDRDREGRQRQRGLLDPQCLWVLWRHADLSDHLTEPLQPTHGHLTARAG
jgi:hypothetical protein